MIAQTLEVPRKFQKNSKLKNQRRKIMKIKQILLVFVGVVAVSVVAVAAVLTPGSGVLSAPVFARASFVDPTDIRFTIGGHSHEVIKVNNAKETVMQQIVIAPGGHTGWHSHPGPGVVLVKAGVVTFYQVSGEGGECTRRTYSAGQAFFDGGPGHVQIARNEGSENNEVWVTYFDVPHGGAFRIDAPDPGNCSF